MQSTQHHFGGPSSGFDFATLVKVVANLVAACLLQGLLCGHCLYRHSSRC